MSLLDCIKSVCDDAADARLQLEGVRDVGNQAITDLLSVAPTVDCLLNGPVGKICANGLPTFAEAWARLNQLSVASIAEDSFTASAGQTAFTLGGSVVTPAALEVELNGAEQHNPEDWTVSGTTLTFVYPLSAGDQVETRRFAV